MTAGGSPDAALGPCPRFDHTPVLCSGPPRSKPLLRRPTVTSRRARACRGRASRRVASAVERGFWFRCRGEAPALRPLQASSGCEPGERSLRVPAGSDAPILHMHRTGAGRPSRALQQAASPSANRPALAIAFICPQVPKRTSPMPRTRSSARRRFRTTLRDTYWSRSNPIRSPAHDPSPPK